MLMADISVRKLSWHEWSGFAPDWERIHSTCADASFFLSREWVDCWLATFGEQLNPELLAFVWDGSVVGCCLLVWRTQFVRGIPLRRVYLNCSGEDESDSTCTEFNSLLSLPDCQESVAKSLVTFLKSRYWDELLLPGVIEQDAIGSLASSLGRNEVEEIPARYIDFSPIREQGSDFLRVLGSKTRYHIRRTQRAYEEKGGACTARLAQNVHEALRMLQQLAELHQARWKAHGSPGCFSSPKFSLFHERLIRQAFDRTLFFRLQAGERVVGLVYCLVYKGWAYHYQSGLCYTLDSRRSPGLLTLYHLITHCLERADLKGFNFMAGDSEYKRSLTAASDYRPLRWFIIRRQTVPNLVFLSLRGLKRKYVQITRESRQSVQPLGGTEPGADVPISNREAGQTGSS
jgi:GNAT acetyltransferase-like protein